MRATAGDKSVRCEHKQVWIQPSFGETYIVCAWLFALAQNQQIQVAPILSAAPDASSLRGLEMHSMLPSWDFAHPEHRSVLECSTRGVCQREIHRDTVDFEVQIGPAIIIADHMTLHDERRLAHDGECLRKQRCSRRGVW